MRPDWTSEVARALCAEVGEIDPEVAIQSLVLQKLSGLKNGTIPVNLDEILEELGIDEVRMEDCPGSGYLLDDGKYCWISVNISESERRRRFSIAHEILHFMLRTDKVGTHHHAQRGCVSRDNEEEYLCDLGASFLLMPLNYFDEMFEGKPVTAARIRKISDTFNVSLEAAIVTVCHRINSDFLVAKWHPNNHGSMSLDRVYRSSQIATEFWLDRGATVSATHPITQVSEARHLKTARSDFCLKRSDRKIYMSGDYLSLGRFGSPVLSVLRPLTREEWKPL